MLKKIRMRAMDLLSRSDPLDRPFVMVTGAPRSGTSMVTKIIDAHPDVAVLMENIFGNRRRLGERADCWKSDEALRREVAAVFRGLDEPVVGNKVCTPSVWSADDIAQFGRLFREFKVVFVVRNPLDVCLSRFKREDYEAEFNEAARRHLLIDFRTQALAYSSSWRQSIETMRRLRDGFCDRIYVLYYEDICDRFDAEARRLFDFLEIEWHNDVARWFDLPHRDWRGRLARNLKYSDEPPQRKTHSTNHADWPAGLAEALSTIEQETEAWKARKL